MTEHSAVKLQPQPSRATTAPTSHIGELEFYDRLERLYADVMPGVDPEAFLLGAILQRVAGKMRSQMESQVRPAGLSIAHMRVLVALGAAGPTTPSEIARLTQVTPQSISSILSTLTRSGHISIESHDEGMDRRTKTISLTDAGQIALENQIRETLPLETSWANALTARQRQSLLFLLRRLAKADDV